MITGLIIQFFKKQLAGITATGTFFLTVFFSSTLYASKPLAAVIGVKPDSIRVLALSGIFEKQLINVINSTGIFDIINPDLLKEQLVKHGCMEEECILGFAKTAGINLLFRGFASDMGNSIKITFLAQSTDYPYFGKVVYKYSAIIPLSRLNLTSNEYKLICEEHAGFFISGCLREYKKQAFIKINKNNEPYVDSDFNINGIFNLYRFEEIPGPGENIRNAGIIGEINIKENKIEGKLTAIPVRENDFIFISYEKKAEFLDQVYYGRKRELVFNNRSSDTAVIFFSTVPLSVIMPVAAPLAYYRNSDFSGLSLWAINTLPYLYLEYDGLANRPQTYKDNRRDIPGKSYARFKFGIYMALCGGIPLVIDAFANQMLYLAGSYDRQPYIGNAASAIYLSLISGGGGLFYKGYRLQGYAYFHLHNILLYCFLKEMSAGKEYNEVTGSYSREKINKKKAYTYLGALTLLKIIEITHVSLIRDNIRNGMQLEDGYALEPAIYDNNNGINFGLQYTFRF